MLASQGTEAVTGIPRILSGWETESLRDLESSRGLEAQLPGSLGRTLTITDLHPSPQAVFNSGIQVDMETRDFEGESYLDGTIGKNKVRSLSRPVRTYGPHGSPSPGLTPLHAAVLSLNEATQQPACGPRTMSVPARDRLACVQMLLQMGADHTSQVGRVPEEVGEGLHTSVPENTRRYKSLGSQG